MMLRVVVLLAILVLPGQVFAQQPKIGYVDSQKIAQLAPQASEAQRKLEEEFGPRDREIRQLRAALRDAEAELDKNAPIMKATDVEAMQVDLSAMRRRLARLQQEFKDELNLRRNEELTKLQRVVIEEIRKIAESEGYDLIIDQAIFTSESIDITDRVISRLRN